LLQEALGTVYLLLPLLGGAIVHGACMRQGWLAFLARPMDGGRLLGGRPWFGRSKTFRGPVCVAGGAAAVFALQQGPLHGPCAAFELVDYAKLPGWLGAGLGAAAELAELPNSFVKRRLGVAPGGTARGAAGVLFYLWDQLDLLVGFWLVAVAFVAATPARLGVSIALVAGIHPLLTLAGYLLGMRPTAR
jgi:CDP-2,3-bis-(O-geranylgeranyl)-sn-glycerol synthase